MIGLLGRLVLSMGVVFLVMALAAKVARNRNFGGMRTKGKTTKIEVLARQPFGKSASVAVVMAGGKALVLGVTDQSVSVLAEADPSAIEIEPEPEAHRTVPLWNGASRSGMTWKALIEQLRERTTRR